MTGRDLERAGPEARVDRLVGDDPDSSLDARDQHLLAHERLPALVLGMHSDGDVGHDRLGARRRDDHRARSRRHRIGPRVLHVIERVGALDVIHLEVGVGRLALRAPVDNPVRAIEMLVLVETDEVRSHRALLRRLHRKVRPRPVQRTAEHPQLLFDAGAVEIHPAPHLFQEFLAADRLARYSFFGELLLDHVLRDDPGVIRAGHP